MDYLQEILRIALLLPAQASSVARGIDALHFVVILTTMLGAAGVCLLALVFCVRYRRRTPEARPHVPGSSHSAAVFIWSELGVIVGLFGLFVAFWGVGYWQYVRLAQPPADAYDIYVSGKQWMWKFSYPDGSRSIDALYVPANRPVRLILTSRDVIHSFFVPDFRIKHDAVPGRYTTTWFLAREPGEHRVFCTEYCGTWHSRMLARVIVLAPADFAAWLRDGEREDDFALDPDAARVSAADSSLESRGQRVAAVHGCLRCHSIDGSPHLGPTWSGLYGAEIPIQGAGTVAADVPYLTESMMDPNAKIREGYAPIMPSYLGFIEPGEVGALVAYIKSLRPQPAAAVGLALSRESSAPAAPAGAVGQPPSQPKRSSPARDELGPTDPLPREPFPALREQLLRPAQNPRPP